MSWGQRELRRLGGRSEASLKKEAADLCQHRSLTRYQFHFGHRHHEYARSITSGRSANKGGKTALSESAQVRLLNSNRPSFRGTTSIFKTA